MKNSKLVIFGNFKSSLKFFLALTVCFLNIRISFSQWVQQTLPQNGGMMLAIELNKNLEGGLGGWKFDPEPVGIAYYTTNGGVKWTDSHIPDSVRSIVDIKFESEKTGFAAGAYNTYVMGRANSLYSNPNLFSEANSNSGMSENPDYKGILLKTTDAGASWFTFGNIPEFYNYLQKIVLINEDTALIMGSEQYNIFFVPGISKTVNGGASWENINIPIDSGQINEMIYNDKIIFSVGYFSDSDIPPHRMTFTGVVLRSSDFGKSWTKNLFPEVNNFNDIEFINESTGYVSGRNNATGLSVMSSIYKTTNAGLNWERLDMVFDSTSINGLCVKENSGAVMFYGNKVEYDGVYFFSKEIKTGTSSDFGINWSTQFILNSGLLLNTQYLDSVNVYAIGGVFNSAGNDPIVLHSTNGGFTSINTFSQQNPDEFTLFQNYPNPFNPVTLIRYSVKGLISNIKITVYDNSGKEIINLVNKKQNAGNYEIQFDGSGLSSGVYFYRLDAGDFSEVRKMVLIK